MEDGEDVQAMQLSSLQEAAKQLQKELVEKDEQLAAFKKKTKVSFLSCRKDILKIVVLIRNIAGFDEHGACRRV